MHFKYNLEATEVLLRIALSSKKNISCFDARQEGRAAPSRSQEGEIDPQRTAVLYLSKLH